MTEQNRESKKVDLRSLYRMKRDLLMNEFELIREQSTHAGTTGDASESGWRAVLSDFLPQRYQVEKAIPVDSTGSCSEQIDIVIFDRQYSPLVVKQNELMYVPVESVYAVLEAKQAISKSHVEYAADKARSVRKLYRTSMPIPHAGGTFKPKEPFPILAGIVTLESDWSPALENPFRQAIASLQADAAGWIDIGCVLGAGAFSVDYGQVGSPGIVQSDAESSLMVFLFTLFEKLRALGTVPAIDLAAYAAWLDD